MSVASFGIEDGGKLSTWGVGEVKFIRKAVLAVAGVSLVGGLVLGGAPVANAANWVSCAGRDDYYRLSTPEGKATCFANYGDARTTLYGIKHLSTGNNSGWTTYMTFPAGTWYDSPYRSRWYWGSFYSTVITGAVHLR